MKKLALGIAVNPLDHNNLNKIKIPEPNFCKALLNIADPSNEDVYVFCYTDYNISKKQLYGYRYNQGSWNKQPVPIPDIVYDRCFFNSFKTKSICERYKQAMKNDYPFVLLNNNLPHKLQVYEQLSQYEILKQLLPPSEELVHFSQLKKWFEEYPDGIILKPVSGMHGKGVIHLTKDQSLYKVNGRDYKNNIFFTTFSTSIMLHKWLSQFKKHLAYMIQPYYHFRNAHQQPFDIRALMQKDEQGRWQLTGVTSRIGDYRGLTSNLHGGGHFEPAKQTLTENMGSEAAEHLLEQIHMISGYIANAIESCFGRFGELAFDLGITKHGQIYLLECNSKPGRQAFLDQQHEIAQTAIERPLAYARYLYEHYVPHQEMLKNYS